MTFLCDKCGECCRHLDQSPFYQEFHNGDGICKYLEGNLCSIYEDRPPLCRVEDCYVLFQDRMSYEEYLALNYKYCAEFKKAKEE